MLFSQNRAELRGFYTATWRKMQTGEALEPLEKQVADVIGEHPEYHRQLEQGESGIDRDFAPEDGQINPFLHMSMHLALREQVGTDRPAGIAMITRSLLLKHGDGHTVEHMMLDCLGEMLWNAQRANTLPDETAYMECLRQL
ncbi:MAG: DUF1841 family protein [Gammaproteobacteria bacterium]|nr:DUF1841 family protein [Gammaproteobacteria bacterium]